MRFYSEYVNHMLRLYVRHRRTPENELKKRADVINWETVKEVLDDLDKYDRNVIIKIYEKRDTISDNVLEVSKELNLHQDIIWTLLNKVTKQIAKERGLI